MLTGLFYTERAISHDKTLFLQIRVECGGECLGSADCAGFQITTDCGCRKLSCLETSTLEGQCYQRRDFQCGESLISTLSGDIAPVIASHQSPIIVLHKSPVIISSMYRLLKPIPNHQVLKKSSITKHLKGPDYQSPKL